MKFFAVGINHETASVRERSCLALDTAQIRAFYRTAPALDAEWLLLSTCNRTELYLHGTATEVHTLQEALASFLETTWPDQKSFWYEDEAAVRHILQVASGLRSQVIGDRQILAQVKQAYQEAIEAGTVRTVMHRLLHSAFRAARRVLNETNLSPVHASVAHLAVAALRTQLTPSARVAVVGAGEMAATVLDALQEAGITEVYVTNRTASRSETLARTRSLAAVPWEERHALMGRVDAAIITTGAPEPVLLAERMPLRHTPALLIDIAVPRNVDPAIDLRKDYRVLDLDTLNARRLLLQGHDHPDIHRAEAICEEVLGEFVTWYFHQQALQPAIHQLKATFEAIRLREIERHAHRFAEADREELDRLTRSIMQKLLAIPVLRLKEASADNLALARRVELLNELFSHPACEDQPTIPEPERKTRQA